MSKRQWVVEIISQIVKGTPSQKVQTAEMIVERLMEEGLLSLGYGDKDVDLIVASFTDTFGTTRTSRTDRFSANRLASKYGAQSVVGVIQLLGKYSTHKYCPVVGSVSQLEQKWVQVLSFLRKNSEDTTIDA